MKQSLFFKLRKYKLEINNKDKLNKLEEHLFTVIFFHLTFFKYKFFVLGLSADINNKNIVPNKKENVTVSSNTSIFKLLNGNPIQNLAIICFYANDDFSFVLKSSWISIVLDELILIKVVTSLIKY